MDNDKNEEYMDKVLKDGPTAKELEEMEQARKANEKLEKVKKEKVEITERIKSIILYIGFVAAFISGVAYINVTIVLINGFETSLDFENQILFSIIGVVVGLSISTMLRFQGIAFAKKNPYAITVMKSYYATLNKTKSIKKLRTITYYLVKATIIDILIKGTIVGVTLWFILDISSKGNGDWELLKLAFANLGLFTGFGLIALSSAFDKYLEEHIPVIIERTKKIEAKIEKDKLAEIDRIKEEEKKKRALNKKTTTKKPGNKKKPGKKDK